MKAFPISKCNIDLSNHEVAKLLGVGGCGKVYLVKDKKTNKEYAAKVMDFQKPHLAIHKEQIIQNEIGIMMNANHPSIIKLYGYSLKDFDKKDNFTILMEYYKNKSLSTILDKARAHKAPDNFTETTRQIILIGIARGMKYLHDRDIIHLDLSSDNILLDDELYPVITDFDFSQILPANQTSTKEFHGGKTIYMAPEVILKKPYSNKADVYSFGIILYEVLTDRFPYPELKNDPNIKAKLEDEIANHNKRPDLSNIPMKDSFKKLMYRCWDNDPDKRPTFREISELLCPPEGADAVEDSWCVIDSVELDEIQSYLDEIEVSDIDKVDQLVNVNDEIEKEKNEIMQRMNQVEQEKQQIEVQRNQIAQQKNQIELEKNKLENEKWQLSRRNQNLIQTQNQMKNQIQDLDKNLNIKIRKLDASQENYDRINQQKKQVETQKQKLEGTINSYRDHIDQMNRSSVKMLNEINVLKEANVYLQKGINIYKKNFYLTSIENDEFEKLYNEYKSLMFSNDLNTEFPSGQYLFHFEIPPGVKMIDDKQFSCCYVLKKIVIPPSVIKIGKKAFQDCIALREITIPPSVMKIGKKAFFSCSELQEVSIPHSVISIGKYAFKKCSDLKIVSILPKKIKLSKYIFDGCHVLKTLNTNIQFDQEQLARIGIKSDITINAIDENDQDFTSENDQVFNSKNDQVFNSDDDQIFDGENNVESQKQIGVEEMRLRTKYESKLREQKYQFEKKLKEQIQSYEEIIERQSDEIKRLEERDEELEEKLDIVTKELEEKQFDNK